MTYVHRFRIFHQTKITYMMRVPLRYILNLHITNYTLIGG